MQPLANRALAALRYYRLIIVVYLLIDQQLFRVARAFCLARDCVVGSALAAPLGWLRYLVPRLTLSRQRVLTAGIPESW